MAHIRGKVLLHTYIQQINVNQTKNAGMMQSRTLIIPVALSVTHENPYIMDRYGKPGLASDSGAHGVDAFGWL